MAADLSAAKPRVGFIGLGSMGGRMARRVADAGFPLAVWSRTASKAREFDGTGVTIAPTARELAAQSDVVFSILTDDAAVESVYLGNDGVVAAARPGTVLVDVSTILPATATRIDAAAAARGVLTLDAAVSGSTPQAEQGALVFFVGGDEALFARCKPLFESMGQNVLHMGPIGHGKATKLSVNLLLGVNMQALAEAVALGEKAGLDRSRLIDVLGQLSVVAPAYKAKLQNARNNAYPPAFALPLMCKDLDLVTRRAAELSAPLPATAAAHQVFLAERARGVTEDFSAVIRAAERAAGVRSAG